MKKKNSTKMKALSLFASAGIAEFGFENTDVEVVISSELLEKRMKVHEFWHPKIEAVCGDITDNEIKRKLIDASKKKEVEFIFATPPCQGVSLIGKNKSNEQMLLDDRNYLIFHVFEIIDAINPKAILIENVARFFKLKYEINGELQSIEQIIKNKYSEQYSMDFRIFNAAEHGVPQHRERAIIRMWKKDFCWEDPIKTEIITLREAIEHLPSLESGQSSSIKNHASRTHTKQHIKFMRHTPTGKSAFENPIYYPKNEVTGEKLKGYSATYKRMSWDKPAPTITMRNDCISSQSNVHPGRYLGDGEYSDARVLTLRELFILSSLNPDLDVPEFASDIQIRHMIGEAVPPKLIYEIVKGFKKND